MPIPPSSFHLHRPAHKKGCNTYLYYSHSSLYSIFILLYKSFYPCQPILFFIFNLSVVISMLLRFIIYSSVYLDDVFIYFFLVNLQLFLSGSQPTTYLLFLLKCLIIYSLFEGCRNPIILPPIY